MPDMVGEGDGTVEVCADLTDVPTGGLECDIVLYLSPSDGAKAVMGEDYNATDPLTITFPIGTITDASACTSISIIDDEALEGEHDFTVHIIHTSLGPDFITISISYVTVWIKDNEVVTVGLQMPDMVGEGDGTVEVCADLTDVPTGGLECDIVLYLLPSDGPKAVMGEDYNATDPLTITFPSGTTTDTSTCTSISIIDDQSLEGEHDFTVHIVHISLEPPFVIISISYVTIWIKDNEDVTVSLEMDAYTTMEASGCVEVCVLLSDIPSGGLECDIVVDLGTMDGKAVAPFDYDGSSGLMGGSGSGSGSGFGSGFAITFDSGLIGSGLEPGCISIIVNDDEILEGPHDFTVLVEQTTPPVSIGSPSSAVIVIEDNENATLLLQDNGLTVEEHYYSQYYYPYYPYYYGYHYDYFKNFTQQFVEVCVEIVNLPSGGLECDVKVLITSEDGNAISPQDYYPLPLLEIVIPGGSMNGSAACRNVTVEVKDDIIVEYDEFFYIILVASYPPLEVAEDNIPVTILDDDKVTVGLERSHYILYEGAVSQVCADLEGYLERAVLVDVEPKVFLLDNPGRLCVSVEATLGLDYFTDTLLLEFGGDASPFNTVHGGRQCFNVTVQDDTIKENDEKFKLKLTSNDSAVCFCRDLAAFTILEDPSDGVEVTLWTSPYTVPEYIGAALVCVHLLGQLETRVSVNFHTSDGTAVAPSDYLPVWEEIVFDACSLDTKCQLVPIINDICLEDDETFSVSISSNYSCVTVNISEAALVIQDDDFVVIGLERYSFSVEEGEEFVEVCAVLLIGEIKGTPVVVELNVGEISASAGADFITNEITLLTFSSPYHRRQCVNITIVDDEVLESTEEFSVVLNATDNRDVRLQYPYGIISIIDNDDVFVEFTQENLEVLENAMYAFVCANLTGEIERSVTVTIFTIGGSAEAGVDFQSTSEDLVFTAMGVLCVHVPIITDNVPEDMETFSAVLTTQDAAVILGLNVATVTIIEFDSAALEFQFVVSEIEVCEGEGSVQVLVELVAGQLAPGVDVILSLETLDGTATAPGDYDAVAQDLTFTSDSPLVQGVSVTIVDDDATESCKEFFVNIGTSFPRVTLPDQATIFLNDDDPLEFCFINDTPRVTGFDVTAEFTVTGCVQSVTCGIDTMNSTDCTSGMVSFEDLPSSRMSQYTLSVELQGCPGQTFTVERTLRTDIDRCWLHLINKGVIIDGDSATFEWEATGPSADSQISEFTCRLDDGSFVACSSPYTLTGLTPGLHLVTIRPAGTTASGETCSRRIGRRVEFEIP